MLQRTETLIGHLNSSLCVIPNKDTINNVSLVNSVISCVNQYWPIPT